MIIPALDLINGNVVRLEQGSYSKQSNYHGNPIKYLKHYFHQGAEIVHLVDLDGAKNPMKRQTSLIHQLLNIHPRKKIQIGGGMRNSKDIETLLQAGANRIVFSSIAIKNIKMTKTWFEYFGSESLVLALDIKINSKGKNKIMINAWKKETNVTLSNIIEEYSSIGLKHVLCTDITRDGTLTGSNIQLYKKICHTWPNISFQSSGGINNLKEIHELYNTGVQGIIIGRAFLEKKFTVPEAISCWQNASSHV